MLTRNSAAFMGPERGPQATYKEAFDLGYNERAVEEALAALPNR